MVPFSWNEAMLKSRVMNKYTSSSATVGVWIPGAWGLELDVFILSCFPAFLILIPVPVFPSFPSVFKGGSSVTLVTLVHGRPKKAKLPNEPNSKVQIPLLNTGDFPFSPVFETGKKWVKKRQFHAIYGSFIGQKLPFCAFAPLPNPGGGDLWPPWRDKR
jgi:hypothetical protein